jgi:hypothetical protein
MVTQITVHLVASFVLIMWGVLLKTPKSSIIKTITKKEIQTIINRDVFRFTKILLIANLESYSNKVGF